MTVMMTTPTHDGLKASPPHHFGPLDALFLYLLGALGLLLILTLLVPLVLGLSPYVVTSVSMEPTLHRGDLIFVHATPFADLNEGDLVAYHSGGSVLTHRVFLKEADVLRTKADASVYLDAAPVTAELLIGRVAYRIPLLGHLALWLGGKEAGA